jgi:peptidoglycan/LPS O-acetylase OafA/YrhL
MRYDMGQAASGRDARGTASTCDGCPAQSRSRLFDSLAANSYAIYLLHYAFVSWLQYALLPASLPGVAKAAIVFLGALGLSWSTAAAIRRIPAVARVI